MPADLAADQNRRLESVTRYGTVTAVDPAQAKCRVSSGGLETDWIEWVERRAGDVRTWSPPSAGEQCLVLSPSGETGAAVAITGIFQASRPAPEDSKDVTATHWPDGAKERYDHAAHEYLLDVPAGGKITLKIGGTTLELTADGATLTAPHITLTAPPITMNGNVTILGSLAGMAGAGGAGGNATFSGRIDATVDVTGAGISLKNHRHDGVQPGGSQTGTPV
jgi:phage baseplate assembly protein V